jgi:secondary thiamine-phosphate synthase enzyme
MILKQYRLSTSEEGLYDVTAQVQSAIAESGIENGLCLVYCPHTTAAITINENADPDVVHDILLGLRKAFPDCTEFRHGEGNSSAHLKASAIGSSATVIVSQGRLVLGTWQGIYFCEFDGPRTRTFLVSICASDAPETPPA